MNEEQLKTEEILKTEMEQVKPEDATPVPPEEIAAQMTFFYTPKFLGLVNKLSNKGLKRLLKALVQYPLQDKDYKHTSEEEKMAFLIGTRLLEAKYVMIFDTYNKNLETLHKAAEGKAEEAAQDNKETKSE